MPFLDGDLQDKAKILQYKGILRGLCVLVDVVLFVIVVQCILKYVI